MNDAESITGVIDFRSGRNRSFGMCNWWVTDVSLEEWRDGTGLSTKNDRSLRRSSAIHRGLILLMTLREKKQRLLSGEMSLSTGTINRYFVGGLMDEIDLLKVHPLSPEYGSGILVLPCVCT